MVVKKNLLLIIYYQDLRVEKPIGIMLLQHVQHVMSEKGGKLLKTSGMKLAQYPYQPSTEDLHRNGKNFPPNYLHKSWMDYLYWDVELEA